MMISKRMRTALVVLIMVAAGVSAQQPAPQPPAAATPDPANLSNLTIKLLPLGDGEGGVVTRIVFRFAIPDDAPSGVPLAIQGSFLQGGTVLRNFRLNLLPDDRETLSTIQTLPEGDLTVEARLIIPLEEQQPVLLGKTAADFKIAATGKPYVAGEDAGAEGAIAEGLVSETAGAVKIRPPRRDVAPNLFIVDVEVKPPVKRVEFWVDGKKVLARSAPPYRAELDLGNLPKRVEVRAVGYDAKGRFVDADAFVVNERPTQLEVKITKVDTPDGMIHFKLSVQNPGASEIKSVVLYAGQKKLHEWTRPPYALSVPATQLAGVEFVRASAFDSTGYEAADLLFLTGERFMEEIEVHIIELPVSVTDAAGVPVTDLQQTNFTVLENGKAQKISTFNFARNLPISVGVLLDHSGSMVKRIGAAKAAAVSFFQAILKPGDRAFFGAFAFDAKNAAPFVGEASLLRAQVDASGDAAGGTSLYDAVVTGLYRFRSVQGRKALIIISDGEDTTSRLTYDDALTYARAARVPLYFIGIGLGFADMAGTSKMKAMAAETGGVAYFVKDTVGLDEAYSKLEADLRTQYLLTYHTESDRKDQKYRTIEVKVDRPNVKVRTIRGFIP
jgi:Ca-activated chloride channel family protein